MSSTIKTGFAALLVTMTLAGTASAQPFDFDSLDADGNGEITQAELDAHRAARFAEADTNGDGELDAAELAAMAEARRAERAARMVARADADGSGGISLDEMPGSDRRGDRFERIDANGDGAISREEAEEARGHRRGHRDGRPGRG
ncbi:calcium-binding protein [Roseobacter sp. HKCCA0434]|uniref:calcium-binding protein n=1 Tax=Roseobacter sp. HKCCA0434 TaxID=3079297 RepID=UPI002905819C|nr:calcium-binding protein [Roseobacter sp. HKCCA0434]